MWGDWMGNWVDYIKRREGKTNWVTPNEVAKQLGVDPRKARALAFHYALQRGHTPRDYEVKGGPTSHIYLMPPDFVEFVKRTVISH